ncbi:MAG: hypothetical protein Q4B60_05310 [Erysipelotrichaceae bacterium]|nr:hypothetical protein [Erysipelotrichaceae bacterium]
MKNMMNMMKAAGTKLRTKMFNNDGSLSLEFVILVVVVVIAAAFALMKFGNVLSTTIGNTTSTVETSTKCILQGYNWDAAAKLCKDAAGNTITL